MIATVQYKRVCLEGLGHVLPDEVISSAEIEQRLAPLYQRLRLPPGRLELMSGIRERRFFEPGALVSDVSIAAADRAIEQSGVDRRQIGALVHGSVCRDFLEPATACRVHHTLGLPNNCAVYDVSNACLGLLSGAVQIANMIELGQISAGVVVGAELARPLVENTIERLNADQSLTRASVKRWVASLTIGSAGAAMVLCDASLSQTGNRLMATAVHSDTGAHRLCQSEGLAEVMQTDSEALLEAGVAAGAATYSRFTELTGWETEGPNKTFCHQVGAAHRRSMLERLRLPVENDYATYEWLGNTGSAALPSALSLGLEAGWLAAGDRVGLLGIGSGVNCLMLGVDWQRAPVGASLCEQPVAEDRQPAGTLSNLKIAR